MNKEDFLKDHAAACERMIKLVQTKNADYTGGVEDPFANFTLVERFTQGRVKTEDGFIVRMCDKLARIESFLKTGTYLVEDEKIEDTCLDLANYSILLSLYTKSKKA